MGSGKAILALLLGAALAAYAVDCFAQPTDASAMQCCQSMSCSPSGHAQDCCRSMPRATAPFVPSSFAHHPSPAPDPAVVVSLSLVPRPRETSIMLGGGGGHSPPLAAVPPLLSLRI